MHEVEQIQRVIDLLIENGVVIGDISSTTCDTQLNCTYTGIPIDIIIRDIMSNLVFVEVSTLEKAERCTL